MAIAAYVSIVGVTLGLQAQFYRIGQVFAFDLIVQRAGAPSPIFSRLYLVHTALIAHTDGIVYTSPLGHQYQTSLDG